MEYKTRVEIQQYLKDLSLELGVSITDPKYAAALDSRDPLAHFRQKFSIPSIGELMEGKQLAQGEEGGGATEGAAYVVICYK